MKFFTTLLLLIFYGFSSSAQGINDYAEADRIALNIPASQTNNSADIAAYINNHLNTNFKKVRAIYTWVAANITYDADSLQRVILQEDGDELVTRALKRKRGVCENFAAVFTDLCKRSGIRSFAIEGYTKQNGSINKTGHAWNGAYIDNKWYLFDPTWDAGYNNNFNGTINTIYFEIDPDEFIQSHMPFDPMFQFLDYPLTFKEFNNGNKSADHLKTYFNYKDSINDFEKLNALNRFANSSARIEKNGPRNEMINTKLSQLKMEMEVVYQDKDSVLYNSAVDNYNDAVKLFNDFLTYRNNQFTPAKTSIEVQKIFDNIDRLIVSSRANLKNVKETKAVLVLETGGIDEALEKLSVHVKEQQVFLKNYVGSSKDK